MQLSPICPRSLTDKVAAFEAVDGGSIPSGDTIIKLTILSEWLILLYTLGGHGIEPAPLCGTCSPNFLSTLKDSGREIRG